jgi:hypothetical protein
VSIARPFKIYPNLDFRFENMPSGNPAACGLGLIFAGSGQAWASHFWLKLLQA